MRAQAPTSNSGPGSFRNPAANWCNGRRTSSATSTKSRASSVVPWPMACERIRACSNCRASWDRLANPRWRNCPPRSERGPRGLANRAVQFQRPFGGSVVRRRESRRFGEIDVEQRDADAAANQTWSLPASPAGAWGAPGQALLRPGMRLQIRSAEVDVDRAAHQQGRRLRDAAGIGCLQVEVGDIDDFETSNASLPPSGRWPLPALLVQQARPPTGAGTAATGARIAAHLRSRRARSGHELRQRGFDLRRGGGQRRRLRGQHGGTVAAGAASAR